MIEYAFGAATGSMASEVAVSTDSRFVKALAREESWKHRIQLVERSPETATDSASIHRPMQEVVRQIAGSIRKFKYVACIPGNVPTITSKTINRCIRALQRDDEATSSMTVRPICCIPEWMWVKDRSGALVRCRIGRNYRMQDFDERFIATGSCAVVRTEVLMTCDRDDAFAWLGSRIVPVPDKGAIEVHDSNDLELARKVLAWL